jgi:putative DNA primase/helicase
MLLPLDEIGQLDPREAGEIAYLLSNGVGKARAGRTGQARAVVRFRVLFLSTGEISLADINAAAGKQTKAAQAVRMVDLPADAGAGFGLFEALHGEDGPAAFAEALRDATRQSYGTALPAFLSFVVKRLGTRPGVLVDELRGRVDRAVVQWLSKVVGAGGQVRSVASRFALVAVGGELATEAGVTGWAQGSATEAALSCFRAWLTERGTSGAQEDVDAIRALRSFIARRGDARFRPWDETRQGSAPDAQARAEDNANTPPYQKFRTQQSIGWRRWETTAEGRSGWRYFLTSDGMREALTGLAQREACRLLAERGFIVAPGAGTDAKQGNLTSVYSVPGNGKVRLYRIGEGLLASADGDG